MELAIPIVALGGMYLVSNQNKKNDASGSIKSLKESFITSNNPNNRANNPTVLPNTNIPTTNYPIMLPNTGSNVNAYSHPNAVTDKFYNASVGNRVLQNPDQFGNSYNPNTNSKKNPGFTSPNTVYSLTGQPINQNKFEHNNMVPFFGAKIKGRTADANAIESVLDTYSGAGSQKIHKEERAPLFAPQNNINYVSGMPSNTDYLQSRVMPGTKMSNVKPWEEIQVGPGLDRGYTAKGSDGFNAGMEARDKWVDRNVDQLRTVNNPKITFGLETHEGPAYNWNNLSAPTPETYGKVEKYLPDKFYLNTSDRWFTTTGIEKAQTARAKEVYKPQSRVCTTTEYFGADSNVTGTNTYAPENYESAKRPEYSAKPVTNAHNGGKNYTPGENDYGRDGYKLLSNNRNTTKSHEGGIIYGALRAVVAPVLDILRPSRKENTIGNIRLYGDVKPACGSSGVVYNPANRAPTTIKETTEGLLGFDHLNMDAQTAGSGYLVNPQQAIFNQRDTTNVQYVGTSGGATNQGVGVYEAQYNQHNNVNKISTSFTPAGNMNLFNPTENICTKRHDDNCEPWVPNPVFRISNSPGVETYGKIEKYPQSYQESVNCARIQPDILDAFRKNPYTQSLHSSIFS
jgi:hypothetical protein